MRFIKSKLIRAKIIMQMKKSDFFIELKNELDSSCFFTSKLDAPGMYVFSDSNGYHHISVGDRGERIKDKITDDIDNIYIEIFWDLSSSLSLKKAEAMSGQDFRREMFKIRLKILESIDKKYKLDGERKINQILSENPYNDGYI